MTISSAWPGSPTRHRAEEQLRRLERRAVDDLALDGQLQPRQGGVVGGERGAVAERPGGNLGGPLQQNLVLARPAGTTMLAPGSTFLPSSRTLGALAGVRDEVDGERPAAVVADGEGVALRRRRSPCCRSGTSSRRRPPAARRRAARRPWPASLVARAMVATLTRWRPRAGLPSSRRRPRRRRRRRRAASAQEKVLFMTRCVPATRKRTRRLSILRTPRPSVVNFAAGAARSRSRQRVKNCVDNPPGGSRDTSTRTAASRRGGRTSVTSA